MMRFVCIEFIFKQRICSVTRDFNAIAAITYIFAKQFNILLAESFNQQLTLLKEIKPTKKKVVQ